MAGGSCSTSSAHQRPPPVVQKTSELATQQQWSGFMLGSLFSGLNNCTVNISLQNFIVNVNPPMAPCATEVNNLLDGIELEDLM